MSKETSTIIKGIAILMMLWYHLLGITELTELCSPLIIIHDKPLVSYIANACYPVSFFLILSGYGLTYLYKQNRLNVKNQSQRLLKLYIHYWVVLLIFVPIGCFLNPSIYPNTWLHVASNLTGIWCTYNGEIWFLFPYALISLLSYYIIHFVYHLKKKRDIVVTLIIYGIIFLIARHIGNNLPEDRILSVLLIHPVYLVILSFYFSIGIVLFRLLENKDKIITFRPSLCLLFIVILFCIKSLFKVTIADGIYAFLMIYLFLQVPLQKHIKTLLYKLGRHSMLMWMTHTFFSVYLFRDFIYGFKYPVIIYLVLVTICYFSSIIISSLTKRIIQYVPIFK